MLLHDVEDLPVMDKIFDTIEKIEELRKELIELLDEAVYDVESIDPATITPDDFVLDALDEDEVFDAAEEMKKAVENLKEYKGWIEDFEFDSLMVIE